MVTGQCLGCEELVALLEAEDFISETKSLPLYQGALYKVCQPWTLVSHTSMAFATMFLVEAHVIKADSKNTEVGICADSGISHLLQS